MPHTVLIIDDQRSLQGVYRMVLQAAGYRVQAAGDALTGVSLARTAQPDAIILDARLPENGSLHVLQRLRRDPHTARIPIVVITCRVLGEGRRTRLAAGIAGSLCKPFPPDALVRSIERVISRAEWQLAG